ncbi:MAG: hypothetical protein QG620_736 [Patescibacteria group bacterium]|nr:hypothetical protein [Patescibacteria group bacterium]
MAEKLQITNKLKIQMLKIQNRFEFCILVIACLPVGG